VGVRLGGQTWDHWGWHLRHPGIGRPWLRGVALGVVMAALALGLAHLAGRATVRWTGDWSDYPTVAGPLALLLLGAALLEELLFRGYPLRRLADAVGPWAATAVFSLGFAAAHLDSPAAGAFGLANIALAGAWLSFAFFSPAGMPLAWGLHFGWNAGLALLFDAPVSGHSFDLPAVEYAPGRHAWVDGGAFGPEGGIVATIVLLAGTMAVTGGRFRQAGDWLV
jgi:membrane protease YdiL (CAAX protease family)